MFRTFLPQLCGIILLVGAAAPVSESPPDVTVIRGFGGAIYEVRTPAPASTAPQKSAKPSAAEAPVSENASACVVDVNDVPTSEPFSPQPNQPCGALTPQDNGLDVAFGLQQNVDFGKTRGASDVDFKKWGADYVTVILCRAKCENEESNGVLLVRVDRGDNVFAERDGVILPKTITAKAGSPSKACGHNVDKNRSWCETITVPWNALELPINARATLTAQFMFRNTILATATIVVDFFESMKVRPSLGHDRRFASYTQYDEYSAETQTPPKSTLVVFPGASTPAVFALAAPFATPTPVPRFPSANPEVDAPLNDVLRVSGAVAQSNSLAQNLQNAIGKSFKLPGKTGDTFRCRTCATFQSRNNALFNLPKAQSNSQLFPKSLGFDDIPFDVTSLPDLNGAAAVYLASEDGASQFGALHANPGTAPAPTSYTDSAFAVSQDRGAATVLFNASLVDHPVAPNSQKPSANHVTAVKLPMLDTYSMFIQDTNTKSDGNGRTSNLVSPFMKIAYDATDRAANGYAGIEGDRSEYGARGGTFSESIVGAYRASGRNYQVLDGVAPAYPTVSGPFANAKVSWVGGNGDWAPTFAISGYTNNYNSTIDHYGTSDTRLQFGYGKYALFYEWTQGRVSAPLAAVNSLANKLGDTPYQTAVRYLSSGNVGTTFPLKDEQIGLSATPSFGKFKGGVDVGYIFYHRAPTCSIPVPTALILCTEPAVPTRQLTVDGSLVYNDSAAISAYVKPPFLNARNESESRQTYNIATAFLIRSCAAVVLSATNDADVLPNSTTQSISSSVAAEVDYEIRTEYVAGDRRQDPNAPGLLPTLVVGATNTFATQNVDYTGINPATSSKTTLSLPFGTHSPSFYVGLRLVTRSLRQSLLSGKCVP